MSLLADSDKKNGMPGSSESESVRSKGFVTKADGLNRNTISTLTQTVSTLTVNSLTLRASILRLVTLSLNIH